MTQQLTTEQLASLALGATNLATVLRILETIARGETDLFEPEEITDLVLSFREGLTNDALAILDSEPVTAAVNTTFNHTQSFATLLAPLFDMLGIGDFTDEDDDPIDYEFVKGYNEGRTSQDGPFGFAVLAR